MPCEKGIYTYQKKYKYELRIECNANKFDF